MTLRNLSLLFTSLFILAACGGGGGGGSYSGGGDGGDSSSCTPSTTNLCITVNSDRKYVVQNSSSTGVVQKTLTLNAGTYVFDQTDSSNSGHPLIILTGGGVSYTTGVTTSGTPGTDGKTQLVITASTPVSLQYQCSVHEGMGGTINIVLGESSDQVEFTETTEANL